MPAAQTHTVRRPAVQFVVVHPRPCLRCGGLHDDHAHKVCARCRATLAKLRDWGFRHCHSRRQPR